jgi:hypothetical protein
MRLRELAEDAVWPDTPDLAERVQASPGARRAVSRMRRRRRALVATVAALVLLPAAGAVAFPGARDDVLHWLGLRSARVERVPAPPSGARAEREADLGPRVSRAQAVRQAGLEPRLPAALGTPDRIRVAAQRISLVYAPRPGLPALEGVRAGAVLTESRGGVSGQFLRKLVTMATGVRRVRVRGRPGAYISGGSQSYLYETASGTVVQERPLIGGPTLLWEQDGLVLRLETRAGLPEALRIARSLD